MRVALLAGCASKRSIATSMPRRSGCCSATAATSSSRPAQAVAARCRCTWDAANMAGAGPRQHRGVEPELATASRCDRRQRVRLRHDGQGLRPSRRRRRRTAIGALARDVTELLSDIGLRDGGAKPYRVAYHDACSLQHGQRVTRPPRNYSRAPVSRCSTYPSGISAAAPPAPTICCSLTSRPRSASEGRAYRQRRSGHRRGRQSRLHGRRSRASPRRRSCTRSNCSIGRPAGRCRRP